MEIHRDKKGRYRRLLILFCIVMGAIFLPIPCFKLFVIVTGIDDDSTFWEQYFPGLFLASFYILLLIGLWLGIKSIAGWIMYDNWNHYFKK